VCARPRQRVQVIYGKATRTIGKEPTFVTPSTSSPDKCLLFPRCPLPGTGRVRMCDMSSQEFF